jgi:hypothetical protein
MLSREIADSDSFSPHGTVEVPFVDRALAAAGSMDVTAPRLTSRNGAKNRRWRFQFSVQSAYAVRRLDIGLESPLLVPWACELPRAFFLPAEMFGSQVNFGFHLCPGGVVNVC